MGSESSLLGLDAVNFHGLGSVYCGGLLWLVGHIPKEKQTSTEKVIIFDITNEKNGLIVLPQEAKKEIERAQINKFSLKPAS